MCHKFCGHKIELHHIVAVADGGTDTRDNCIALCFDCHAEVRAYDSGHPKGRRFTASELRQHRDNWFAKVEKAAGMPVDDSRYLEIDRKLFEEFQSLVGPQDIIISVFTHPNLGFSPFRFRVFAEVDEFLAWAERPDKEFLDGDLEHLRRQFVDVLGRFSWYLGGVTFLLEGEAEISSVPSEWEYEQPDRYAEAQARIEEFQGSLKDAYVELIRTARRKLA